MLESWFRRPSVVRGRLEADIDTLRRRCRIRRGLPGLLRTGRSASASLADGSLLAVETLREGATGHAYIDIDDADPGR